MFLLMVLVEVEAMDVMQASDAYCGGAGGGDDGDDWGHWKGQIAFSTLRTNTKNKETTKKQLVILQSMWEMGTQALRNRRRRMILPTLRTIGSPGMTCQCLKVP